MRNARNVTAVLLKLGDQSNGVSSFASRSREQFFRNALGWGFDFERLEREGQLKVVTDYPEIMRLEDHFIRMQRIMEDFKPNAWPSTVCPQPSRKST